MVCPALAYDLHGLDPSLVATCAQHGVRSGCALVAVFACLPQKSQSSSALAVQGWLSTLRMAEHMRTGGACDCLRCATHSLCPVIAYALHGCPSLVAMHFGFFGVCSVLAKRRCVVHMVCPVLQCTLHGPFLVMTEQRGLSVFLVGRGMSVIWRMGSSTIVSIVCLRVLFVFL